MVDMKYEVIIKLPTGRSVGTSDFDHFFRGGKLANRIEYILITDKSILSNFRTLHFSTGARE